MKTSFRSLLLAACCTTAVAAPWIAQGAGLYVDVDAGVALADKVDLKRFVLPTPGGTKMKFDPGARLSVAVGYNFNDYLGAQFDTGVIYNEVDSVSGAARIDASLSHVPLMADIVLRCDRPNSKWVPYIGIGAGGDVSMIALDHVRTGAGVIDGADSTIVFACQAFAGIRYKFTEKMSIGAAYKFYDVLDDASWNVEHARGDIKIGDAMVHSAVVDFTIAF